MLATTILSGLLPLAVLPLLALCLLVSAIGFRRLVWFISIGYGFSVAAMAIASLALGWASASPITWVAAILLAIYGLRLGLFLALREGKAAYRASQEADGDRSGEAGLGIKVAIWLTVALLYVAMFLPVLSRFHAEARGLGDPLPILSGAGLLVTALGILIEAIADRQKSAAKKRAPGRFCDSGLYRLVRCPNYFGELLVWTGSLVSGASLQASWLSWLASLAGYAAIYLIMKGSARRLELKQGERYAQDPDYARYAASTPILFPFLPIYSFRKSRIYLG